jgi:four helix bundle protein
MARSYRELLVWQLAEAAYAVAAHLPEVERFGLTAQLRRAAVSVLSNIAEGHERRSRAEYRRFIAIACGSLAELETHLELSRRIHHIAPEHLAKAESLADETGRLLRAIERSLKASNVADDSSPYDAIQPSALSPQPS